MPVGNSVGVDNNGWIVRQFTPSGVLNWSWSITALAPGDQQLQLEPEPAVTSASQYILLQGGNPSDMSTSVTQVHVNASAVQRAGQWWKDNWGIIVLISGGIGAAVLSLIKWSGNLGQAVHDLSRKWRDEQKDEG